MATLAEKKRDLEKIAGEAEKIENEYKGKTMPEDVGTKLDDLYKEGERLSVEVDNEVRRGKVKDQMKSARQSIQEVPDPMLPAGGEQKAAHKIEGYVTPGQLFAVSPMLQAFTKARMPRTCSRFFISTGSDSPLARLPT